MIDSSIPVYNPAMPDELKEEALRKNSEALYKQANSTAANLIASVSVTIGENITGGAADANITALTKAFSASGGLIGILASVHYYNATAGAKTIFSMWIDGTQKARKAIVTTSSGTNEGNCCLFWFQVLNQGQHKVEIKASSSDGTIVTPRSATDSCTSELFIIETIL
jgi:hypothetical protein